MEESLELGKGSHLGECPGEPLGAAWGVIKKKALISQSKKEAANGCKWPIKVMYLFRRARGLQVQDCLDLIMVCLNATLGSESTPKTHLAWLSFM